MENVRNSYMYSVLKVQISDNHITIKILEKSNNYFRLSAYTVTATSGTVERNFIESSVFM